MTARPASTPASPPSSTHTNAGLALELPDALVEVLAERVADILAERQSQADPEFLTVTAAAELLRCKPQRVYALVSQGRLPHLKDGARVLIRREELLEYLEGGAPANA